MFVFSRSTAARAAAILALAASATAVACADGTGPAKTGTMIVRLTDAPLDSVKEVNVFVIRIDAKAAESDSSDAAANADSSAKGGWTTVAEPNKLFDLLKLRNDTATVGTTELPEGDYRSLRLVIDPAQSYIILKDGTRMDGRTNMAGTAEPGIKFPSAATSGIKVFLSKPVEVEGDDTTQVDVDFDAAQSFSLRGTSVAKGGFIFKPVIRATSKAK